MLAVAQSRRRFLLTSAAGSLVLFRNSGSALAEDAPAGNRRPALLVAPRGVDELPTRSRIVLQLAGTLRVPHPDPTSKKPPREAEVKAESTVDYDERVAFDPHGSALAAARLYHEAKVDTWVGGRATAHQLSDAARDIRVALHDGTWHQYCPTQPLTPKEVDLVRVPLNTLVVDQLLPAEPVKADSQWSPDEQVVAELFHLDAVHVSTLKARVAKVESGVATIEFDGAVEGTVAGVSTKLNVKGNLTARLGSRCAIVTWVGLSMTEVRAISQSEPGFTITAMLKLIRKEEPDACADVSRDELQLLAGVDDPSRWLIRLASSSGRYQMLADRRWKVIADAGEEAILRLVDNNQIVAQCNITRLPAFSPGQQLTLEGFQEDIRRTLGQSLVGFAEAAQRVNSGGVRVLRVVADGMSSEIPVRWVYCHLSDDSGRRYSMVFTMSGEQVEAFALADDQVTGSFELLAEPEPSSQPTPAPKTEGTQSAGVPTLAPKPVER
jgi:hypothetical protein